MQGLLRPLCIFYYPTSLVQVLNSYFYCHDNFFNKQKLLTNTALTALLKLLHLNNFTVPQILRKTWLRHQHHLSWWISAGWPFAMTNIQAPQNCPFTRFNDYIFAASKYLLQFPLHTLSFIITFLLLGVHKLHGTLTHAETSFQANLPWCPQWLWASSPSHSLRIAPTLPPAFG